jgi:hypothetical protein
MKRNILPALAVALTLLALSAPAFAASTTAPLAKAQDRAKQEITRRTDALTKLSARIGEMQKLSASEKASLSSGILTQINILTALEAKIAADTDAATLKTDVQSITKSYRIFALIIPQGAIAAASDRVESTVATSGDISTKLQARITSANSAGHDTSALSASLVDMNAKTANANTQAEAAVSETASLTPDNGDTTLMQSNTSALKDARAKLKTAEADLKAAKADAESIAKALKGFSS